MPVRECMEIYCLNFKNYYVPNLGSCHVPVKILSSDLAYINFLSMVHCHSSRHLTVCLFHHLLDDKPCTLSLFLKVATGNLLALLSRHFQRVSCLKFTDDGSHLLSSGEDNLVLVWKMARYSEPYAI